MDARIVEYNITVYQEEVVNISLSSDVIDLSADDVQGVDFASIINLQMDDDDELVAVENDGTGVLTYTGEQPLTVGDVIAVRDGQADSKGFTDGSVAYVKLTQALGDGQYAYEQAGVEDILFLGTVNVKIYMKEFDFTVLSSISEGQPLSVLESFAAGRPCVVTDVGCCKELVYGSCADNARGGETPEQAAGICVPPMQPHALSLAMEKLCRDRTLREAMGREAKRRAEREFRHETMVRNYLNAYDEVFQEWQESDFN